MLSTDFKKWILNSMSGKNNQGYAPTCYIGLSLNDETGTFTEPAASSGYERGFIGNAQSVNNAMTVYDSYMTNTSTIFVSEATADWGTMHAFGLFRSKDADEEPFLVGNLTNAVTVNSGYIPIFRKNSLTVEIDSEG